MVVMTSYHPQALVASRATQPSLFVPSLLPSLSTPRAAAGAADSSRRTHTRSKQFTHTWSTPPFMNPAGNRPLGTRPVLAYHLAPAAARVGSGSAGKGVRSRHLVRGQTGREATGVLGNGTREESLPGMSGERAREGEQQERVGGSRTVKEFPVKPRVPLPTSGPLAAPDWVRKAVAEQPWKGGLEPCGEQSYGLAVESVEGTIPDELKGGTLYRCGPGSIIKFGGRVLALCEGGLPCEVDPITLHTKGSVSLEGMPNCVFSAHPKLDPDTGELYSYGLSMGASVQSQFYPMVLSPSDGALSVRAGPAVPVRVCDGPTLVHDCAMSANHLVFAVPPYNVSLYALLMSGIGLGAAGGKLTWHNKKPTEFLFVSKTSLELVGRVEVFPPFSSYHFCNAWEEDGRLHVLLCVLDGPRDSLESAFKDMYGSIWQRDTLNTLWEFEFDMATWRVVSQRPAVKPPGSASSSPPPSAPLDGSEACAVARSVGEGASEVLGMEFPQVNPRYAGKKSRFVYVLASAEERLVPSGPSHANAAKVSVSGNGVHGEMAAAASAGSAAAPAASAMAIGSRMLVNGAASLGYFNCLQKYDLQTRQVQTHMFPPGWYASDTNFIPRHPMSSSNQLGFVETGSSPMAEAVPVEDEGYVVTTVYNSFTHTSKVVVIDGQKFEGSPVCILPLSTHVPYYFHGDWAGRI